MHEILQTTGKALGATIVVVISLRLGIGLLLSWRRVPKGLSLPPGPTKKPFVGNLFDFPRRQQWLGYSQLAKIYGDIVYLTAFGQSIVVINSAEVAYELFEKRSSIYSDRSEFPMINELMGCHWAVTFMRYGERWRSHRRVLHKKLHSIAAVEYQSIQLNQTRALLERLCETPDDFVKCLRHTSGAIIMEVAYGIKVLPKDDPYIVTAETVMAGVSAAGQPGSFLVDTFPILKYVPEWVPGAGFQKKAKIWRKCVEEMNTKPFEAVKESLKYGTVVPSYTSSLLEELSICGNVLPDKEETIRDTGAVLYAGGSETTVVALHVFFLAMILFPDAQRNAQKELDEVVGPTRLPEFGDRANLPYINALCKEVIRWHPILPLGVAHRLEKDDVIGGHIIPASSIILGNAWHMLRNETVYGPDTDKFLPERFLTPGMKDPTIGFGFGRRICPGRHLANNSIYIAVASILSVFDVTPMKDRNGKEIPVVASFKTGLVAGPEPFQCAITPRSDAARNLIFQDSASKDHQL